MREFKVPKASPGRSGGEIPGGSNAVGKKATTRKMECDGWRRR